MEDVFEMFGAPEMWVIWTKSMKIWAVKGSMLARGDPYTCTSMLIFANIASVGTKGQMTGRGATTQLLWCRDTAHK